MTKISDVVKRGVVTGDDLQKVFKIAKENHFVIGGDLYQMVKGFNDFKAKIAIANASF